MGETSDMLFPPSIEQMMESARLEGFYETTYKMLERRTAALWRDLIDTRAALEREKERVVEMEHEMGDWRALAFQHAVRTEAGKWKGPGVLHGSLSITQEMVRYFPDQVIAHACADLAKKLRAQVHPPTPGGTDGR